jgi:hypothetical protein
VLGGVVASQALGPGRHPRAVATLQEESCRFVTEVQDWFGFDSNERAKRYPPGTEPRTVVPFPAPVPAGRWANDPARR